MLTNFQKNFNSLSMRHISLVSASLHQHKSAAVASPNKKPNIVLSDAIPCNMVSLVQKLSTDVAQSHGGHGHHAVNYGPPITYDYLAIPSQPYKKVYTELRKKFKIYLAMSIVFFSFALYVGYVYDVMAYSAWRLPGSYRNRKEINARLDAEEAKAKVAEGER